MNYSVANLKRLLKENEDIDPYKVDYYDPNTPSEHLAAVYAAAKGPGANVVIKGLASNPNTPPHILSELLPSYEGVWKNPALDLLQLEDPNFIKNSLQHSGSGELTARSAIHWIAQNDPNAGRRLAFHPNLEPEHIDAIFDNIQDKSKPNIFIGGLLKQKPDTSKRTYERLKELFPHQAENLFLSKSLAQILKDSPEIAKSNPEIVKDALINGFHAPAGSSFVIGHEMAGGLSPHIPMLDKEAYDKVKEHPNFKTIAALPALLSSPHADPSELENQARVRNKATETPILQAIAKNPATPEHVLSKLAGHRSASISKAAFKTMTQRIEQRKKDRSSREF